jgi:succinate dehydrogenase / fumarate reductase cytochrome b subunit
MSVPSSPVPTGSFLSRHEFLIRRLHSLSGLIPVGAYMCVHLLTNASLLAGAARFQTNVNMIHNLGPILPLVEWAFIFIPIIFHAVAGVWIAQSGHSNTSSYPYTTNRRYSWQRWTGYLAFVFIFFHVFHLHGWFHSDWWLRRVAEPLGMAQFRPYNAASTLAEALGGFLWPIFYAAGVLACCYHLANGIWTAGITWGLWLTPPAQRRATKACAAFGVLLSLVGLSALWAAKTTDVERAKQVEDGIYHSRVQSGEIDDDPHKRSGDHSASSAQVGQVEASQPMAVKWGESPTGGPPISSRTDVSN